jgi:hypothetical protein
MRLDDIHFRRVMNVFMRGFRNLSMTGTAILGVGLFVGTIGLQAQQAAPAAAAACRITGTITGLGTPLPGVSVTARRGGTVQAATSTDIDGTFRLSLPPDSYQIAVDLTGFTQVQRDIALAQPSCEQQVDAELALTPRTPPVATANAGGAPAAPNGRGRGAGPAGAGGQNGQNGQTPGIVGLFETLQLNEDSATAGIAANLSEPDSASPSLLPSGFGSEALSESFSVTGEAARVNNGNLNQRRDALQRGDFQPNFDGGPVAFGDGGGPNFQGGRGRGGGGGNNNQNFIGGRGGRGARISSQVQYRFSGSALDSPRPQLRSEVAGVEAPYSNHNVQTSVQGPLRIPGLFRNPNNTTTFSLQLGGTRGGNGFDQYATVPSEAMRAGDFSSVNATLYDPLTGQPFPNNQIPADRISPQARALLEYYPAPNLSGQTRNYHFTSTTEQTNNSVQFRIQHNFSGQAQGGRGGRNGGAATPQTSNAGRAGRGQRLLGVRTNVNMTAQIQYQQGENDQLNVFTTLGGRRENKTIGVPINFNIQRGRTQHQISVTYNHTNNQTLNRFSNVSDVSGLIGLQGVSQSSFAWGLPRLSFSSISGLSDVTPSLQVADRYSTTYRWSRPVGRQHSVRIGGDFRYDVTKTNTESNANGNFVFTGLYSSNGGQLGGLTYADFADFLLGMPQQASIQYGPGETTLTGRTLGIYIEDDWRARPNLTMQLGLRYDLLWPFVEENGQLVNLDVTPDFTAAAPVAAGEAGAFSGSFPSALVKTDTNNLAPRIALAWSAPGQFIVNPSYAVNYNNGTYSGIARQLAQQPPFATTGTNIGSLSTALLMENALSGISPSDTRNNYGIDKDYVLGLVQETAISVRRELGRTFLASVQYTHTRGSNLEIVRAPNRDPNGGLRIDGVQPFTWTTAEGRSRLNSATFRLQRRQTSGIGWTTEYTIAKSRDNSPSIGGGGGGGGNVAQNDQDIESEWGLSNFDQRHRFTLQVTAELPFGQGRRWLADGGFLAALLDRWRFTANFTADSGRPRSVTVRGAARDISSGVNGALRADYNGEPVEVEDPSIDRWFNTDAFLIPSAGAYGNSSRNIIIGPGSKNLNAQIQRSISLGNNRNVNLQIQIQNILNMANYSGVDTNVNSPTFGQVTGVSGQRRGTVNLTFQF